MISLITFSAPSKHECYLDIFHCFSQAVGYCNISLLSHAYIYWVKKNTKIFSSGTSANLANMQLYLLESISRCSKNRRAAASLTSAACFDLKLLTSMNDLSGEILDKSLVTFFLSHPSTQVII